MKEKEFKNPWDLIKTINPQMSPERAVAQVKKFNRIDFNETKIPVIRARNELLQRSGYNSKDWTYYLQTCYLNGEGNEDKLRELARPFSKGVELLVFQGSFIGGVSGTLESGSWGIAKYEYNPSGYTAFIRVRPKQLKGKQNKVLASLIKHVRTGS